MTRHSTLKVVYAAILANPGIAISSTWRSDGSVERVGDLLTMHLGPEQVLLAAEIKFRDGVDVQESLAESILVSFEHCCLVQHTAIHPPFID